MKRRLAILSLLLAVAALGVAFTIHWFNREPAYEGRPLSAWVEDLGGDYQTVQKAHEALAAMQADAVPFLAAELSPSTSFFEKARRAISPLVPDRVRAAARKVLKPYSAVQRKVRAAKAIQFLGANGAGALPALFELLTGPDVFLSGVAAKTLAAIGPAAVPHLIEALHHPRVNVRSGACLALRKIGKDAAAAAPRLCELLIENNPSLNATASYTLSRLGVDALPSVLPLLASTNASTRRWSAYAIGYMGPPAREQALPHLIPLASDPIPAVRTNVISAIGRLGTTTPEAEAILLEAFRHSDPATRAAAIHATHIWPLFILENLEASAALLSDPSPQVRLQAARAMAAIAPYSEPALQKLEALAQDPDPRVRGEAVRAAQAIRRRSEPQNPG